MTDFGVAGEDDGTDLDGMLLDAGNFLLPDHHNHHHPYFLDDGGGGGGNNPSSFVPDPNPLPSADNSLPSTIRQIDHFLFNEDHDLYPQEDPDHHLTPASSDEEFLSDLLLHSPLPPHPSSSEIHPHYSDPNPNLAKNSSEEDEQQPTLTHQLPPPAISQPQQGDKEEEHQFNTNDNNNCDDADPDAKKRKRQLRNRDAAVQSRERKKLYVKDLEMKSRYYEAECRRLGMLLHCYVAENHALRLSFLNNNTQALDAFTTKQESAVLILESLLLGSLLWFLGIMALFTLPKQLLLILAETGVEKGACQIQGSLAPREAGTDVYGVLEFQSFMMSKRCRGSRRKMRCPTYEVKFQTRYMFLSPLFIYDILYVLGFILSFQ